MARQRSHWCSPSKFGGAGTPYARAHSGWVTTFSSFTQQCRYDHLGDDTAPRLGAPMTTLARILMPRWTLMVTVT